MRLLNTKTLRLESFVEEPFPEYAILSHRWGNEEISFQELESGSGFQKNGYHKIHTFCEKARSRGLKWCWVDTCAIDKTSSAELSEAINSMYKWYENSSVCFAYLPDVKVETRLGSSKIEGFKSSCWFTRGWTLQELLAPCSVEFYASNWIYIGDKRSMAKELSAITMIGTDVLLSNTAIQASSVATIMSWASRRVTTRKEDIAYCLLGLFRTHMPLLYGEGDRAFTRLQEEILKQSSDQSLFAWDPPFGGTNALDADSVCGILAPSPACFANMNDIRPLPGYWDTESTLTNRGIRLRMPLKYESSSRSFIGILSCMCITTAQDIAIEFHSTSNSLEDYDHLIRRLTPIRRGNWNDDAQVQFSTVYLATEPALWHVRHFGPCFLKTEYEFHVLLQDPDSIASPKVVFYPTEALVTEPSIKFKVLGSVRRIAVLNPANSPNNSATLLLPTNLSQDLALWFGFRTLQNGLLDVQHPWKAILPISKDCMLEDVCFDREKLQTAREKSVSNIMIDGVRIEVDISQQSWWARTSRNILISLTRNGMMLVANHESTFPSSENGGWAAIKLPGLVPFGSTENVTKKEIEEFRATTEDQSRMSTSAPKPLASIDVDLETKYRGIIRLQSTDEGIASLDNTKVAQDRSRGTTSKVPSASHEEDSSKLCETSSHSLDDRSQVMPWN